MAQPRTSTPGDVAAPAMECPGIPDSRFALAGTDSSDLDGQPLVATKERSRDFGVQAVGVPNHQR
jgi:hypothetical protein